jgi:Topoisomerase IB
LKVSDRRVARIVKSGQALPGQHLFQYEDATGNVRRISSSDVNAYLREIAGNDVSAKDFRTWAGTVLATMTLRELAPAASEAAAKRDVRQAIAVVAARLGNTISVCRKCYVHPEVLSSYLEGTLLDSLQEMRKSEILANLKTLPHEEAPTLAFLQSHLSPANN